MGLTDTLNRAIFNLTYNEQASQAYDEQNAKAAGAVEDIKKILDNYRQTREKVIGAGESSDYFASYSLARLTEWNKWLEKNGGLAPGDYTKKETEMKAEWQTILNSNKVAKEIGRIPAFLDLYVKDKDTKIPNDQKTQIDKLKADAEQYISKMTTQTPADLIAKRDAFNTQFDEIQKKIPENFEDLKIVEPFATQAAPPPTLLAGIQEQQFKTYEKQVEQKEKADENTFQMSRLATRVKNYFSQGFQTAWPYLFGIVFGMIAANDAIGRPALYRVFFFVYMIIMVQFGFIPGFSVLVFVYYLYRAFVAINWTNFFSFHPEGPRMDYMKAPVLFAFLPIFEGGKDEQVPWYYSIFKYDRNRYGGLAQKKQMAYEISAGKLVGKQLSPSDFDMEPKTFEEVLSEVKSYLLGQSNTFDDALKMLKNLLGAEDKPFASSVDDLKKLI